MNITTSQPVVFHVGFQKVASTTLQRSLFARHSGVCSLAKPASTGQAFFQYVVKSDYARYEKDVCIKIWNDSITDLALSGGCPVFSHENLAAYNGVDATLVAHRLVEIFGQIKALFVIRDQLSLLASIYTHLIATDKSDGTYLGWLQSLWSYRHSHNFLTQANYWNVVAVYRKLFGHGSVCVLLYEDFVGNQPVFVTKLCDFIGIDTEEALHLVETGTHHRPRSSRSTFLGKRHPLFSTMKALARPIAPAPIWEAARRWSGLSSAHSPTLDSVWRPRLSDFYAPGNRSLAETFDLGLDGHGYPMR